MGAVAAAPQPPPPAKSCAAFTGGVAAGAGGTDDSAVDAVAAAAAGLEAKSADADALLLADPVVVVEALVSFVTERGVGVVGILGGLEKVLLTPALGFEKEPAAKGEAAAAAFGVENVLAATPAFEADGAPPAAGLLAEIDEGAPEEKVLLAVVAAAADVPPPLPEPVPAFIW